MNDFKDQYNIMCRKFQSHGDGIVDESTLFKIGHNVVFERGAYVFHPEHIEIGENVYVGHGAYLKAYYKNKLVIGNNVWIGQSAYLHAGGGITIEDGVGIGPFVKILTMQHVEVSRDIPILYSPQEYKHITIKYGTDIGVGAIVLPGITIGKNCIIGAGTVVTKNIPDYSVVVGNPAKVIRRR